MPPESRPGPGKRRDGGLPATVRMVAVGPKTPERKARRNGGRHGAAGATNIGGYGGAAAATSAVASTQAAVAINEAVASAGSAATAAVSSRGQGRHPHENAIEMDLFASTRGSDISSSYFGELSSRLRSTEQAFGDGRLSQYTHPHTNGSTSAGRLGADPPTTVSFGAYRGNVGEQEYESDDDDPLSDEDGGLG